MSHIIITLSAANMGDVDEIDFDLWAAFVTEKIDEATGIEVAEVAQFAFTNGASEDHIAGATAEDRETLRLWLSVDGWDAFCGEEWESRRKAHDAAA